MYITIGTLLISCLLKSLSCALLSSNDFLDVSSKYALNLSIKANFSAVAAASKSAKFWLDKGGFNATVLSTNKVGQVHFIYKGDFKTIKKYFDKFPGIKKYMEDTKALCREQGYVETLCGRKCFFPKIKDKNFAFRSFQERAAINAPIQGTAADIISEKPQSCGSGTRFLDFCTIADGVVAK
mgnify:CR=1 FL=1